MSIGELTTTDSEKVIESFRQGTEPIGYSELYSVGRERWLKSVKNDLDFVARGGSKVRFLSAPYGGGKTHFLTLLKARAISAGFLTSHVELQSREAPFDKFEVIFPKIMRNMTVPDNQTIERMLIDWARAFPYYNTHEIEAQLAHIAPSLDFRSALRTCLRHANTDSPDHSMRIQGIVAWLQGYRLMPELKGTGIRANITIANVTEVLGSFLRFTKTSGNSGLVLLLDEHDAITSLTQSQRRSDANQNIRKLLDNADEHTNLYVLFATTPKFLTDPDRGAQSFPALWDRIKHMMKEELQPASSRATLMVLEAISQADLEDLAQRIVKTHAIAYDWDPWDYFDQMLLRKYVVVFLQHGDARKVRSFIRHLVYILDVLEENRQTTKFDELLHKLQFDDED
jgi:hypothetical protein